MLAAGFVAGFVAGLESGFVPLGVPEGVVPEGFELGEFGANPGPDPPKTKIRDTKMMAARIATVP